MSLHLEGKVDLCWVSRHLSANGIGALFIQLEDQNILKHIYKKKKSLIYKDPLPRARFHSLANHSLNLKEQQRLKQM